MNLIRIPVVILAVQIGLYAWLVYTYFFARWGHVPVAYIVLHLVAAINAAALLISILVCLTLKTSPAWLAVAGLAMPSILVVGYVFLQRFF